MFTISNCLHRTLEFPKSSLKDKQKQVYIIETLSNITLSHLMRQIAGGTSQLHGERRIADETHDTLRR